MQVQQEEDAAPGFLVYLEEARRGALDQIRGFVAGKDPRYRAILYDLMLEYPMRPAKGLRPALCIASCRALGGSLDAVLPTAAVFELYHNAFLIHDDVEDRSELRRGAPTLHREHGVPVAVNTADGMLALAFRPLLSNLELLGLGKTLALLEAVARMAEESAEGQALELHFIHEGRWDLLDDDYLEMVMKKTAWYSFVTPLLGGAIAAGADEPTLGLFAEFGRTLGVAFQIQDDILNLAGPQESYGKECEGDLWEGKYSLPLLHALRLAADTERADAMAVLARPREHKTAAGVAILADLIRRTGALDTSRRVAMQFVRKTEATWASLEACLLPSVHRAFLGRLVRYVTERDR